MERGLCWCRKGTASYWRPSFYVFFFCDSFFLFFVFVCLFYTHPTHGASEVFSHDAQSHCALRREEMRPHCVPTDFPQGLQYARSFPSVKPLLLFLSLSANCKALWEFHGRTRFTALYCDVISLRVWRDFVPLTFVQVWSQVRLCNDPGPKLQWTIALFKDFFYWNEENIF